MALVWDRYENDQFEGILSGCLDRDGAFEPDWNGISLPGKSAWDLKQQFDRLVEDVKDIDAGRVEAPDYMDVSPQASSEGSTRTQKKCERRKGLPWSVDEHRRFLTGLEEYGKSDWKSISRFSVKTRTPTQVASHAQKYFNRLESTGKERRRNSIHDITSATVVVSATSNRYDLTANAAFMSSSSDVFGTI